MRISTIADRLTRFRVAFSPWKEDQNKFQDLRKYYLAMLESRQLEIILSQTDKENRRDVLSTCEVWFVNKSDIKRIIKKQKPMTFSFGNIAFIANVTSDPRVSAGLSFWYYRKLLKQKYPYCKYCCWFNFKRNRMSKIFEVQRNV